MAEMIKEIKTRVALRTGDYAYWTTGAGKDIELYKGEVCICTIEPKGHPYDVNGKETGAAHTAPTVLFKVANANGQKFADLNWVSGLAADVYDWAKAATKPTYAASEITGLDEYIAGEIQDTDTDTQYRFAVEDGALSVYKTVSTLGVAGAETKVGSYDFVTPGELTEILKSYYTKTEVDNLIQGVNDKIDGLDESVTTVTNGTGIAVTDGGTGNDHAYTVALDVNGAKTALGLDAEGIAAYESVSVLNATAKGYADAVDAKIRDDLSTGALEAREAQYANTAGKVQSALTVKVGGADVVFDGSAAKTADVDAAIAAGVAEAKKHADDNDANTEYHVEYDSTNKKIRLVAGADASKMEIPTDDFIKDGMIQSVEIKDNKLVITWNTDAGKSATEIPLTELVDIMTGVDGTTVTVNVSADDKISAEVKTGSLKDGHIASDAAIAKSKLAVDVQTSLGKADTAIQEGDLGDLAFKDTIATADINDKAVTEAKLEQNVQNALALARTALQEHQDISGKKDKQSVVENLINKEGHGPDILTSLSQNENGVIDYSVTTLHGSDIYLSDADSNNSMTIRDAIGELADITINGKAIATKDFGTNSTLEARSLDEDIKSVIATEKYAKDSELTEAKNKIKALEDAKHISAVEADTGLKVVTGSTGSENKVAIDDEVVFVLNCNF